MKTRNRTRYYWQLPDEYVRVTHQVLFDKLKNDGLDCVLNLAKEAPHQHQICFNRKSELVRAIGIIMRWEEYFTNMKRELGLGSTV